MFDLSKFLANKYQCGESRDIWNEYGTPYVVSKYGEYDRSLKYPITRIYEFYPWEEMALGYYGALRLIHPIVDAYGDDPYEDPDY
jgi:hypothetical protein